MSGADNLGLPPVGFDVIEFKFPPLLDFTYTRGGKSLPAAIPYLIGGCSPAMVEAFNKKYPHLNGKPLKSDFELFKARVAADDGPRPPPRGGKSKMPSREDGLKALAALAGISKRDIICKDHKAGKCNYVREGRARKCGFCHTVPSRAIPCAYGKECSGLAKGTCGYQHDE